MGCKTAPFCDRERMLRLCDEDDKPLEARRATVGHQAAGRAGERATAYSALSVKLPLLETKVPAELRTPSPERVAAVVSNSATFTDGALYAVPSPLSLFFFILVTGPRRSLSLKLSDTRVYEPQIRARLGTTALQIPRISGTGTKAP